METKFEPKLAAQFLRTLRVATGVAVSLEDVRRRSAPSASFLALAAKIGEWRFPSEGLLSGDGLLLATRLADDGGALLLQAQGAAGVTAYAGRRAQAVVGDKWSAQGAFDRFGAMRLPLGGQELDDAALARFDVELLEVSGDGAP